MTWGINWPDWKGALQESFRDYLQSPLEKKANEWKEHLSQQVSEFQQSNNKFQQAIIAILFASFLVGVIAVSCPDYD